MLIDREIQILDTVIRDYVAQALPVSSNRILEICDFGLSSASIRASLASLEQGGYISQPHTSAGRIPTQKGYRFFVDNLMDKGHALPISTRHRLDTVQSLQDVVKIVAEETHMFTLGTLAREEAFFNFGVRELLGEPEFEDTELVRKFSSLIDVLIEEPRIYEGAVEGDGFTVFIEEENPLPEARCASVMVSRPKNGKGMLLTVGPARMNYERTSSIVRSSALYI